MKKSAKKNKIFSFLKDAIIETQSKNGIVLHSDIVFLRKYINKEDNLIKKIFEESSINTLYLPTFSYYGFNKKKETVFNISNEAHLMGALPNYAINNKIGFRTVNPIHSYIGIGELNRDLFRINNNLSFGKKSIFDFFSKQNYLWCSLGCNENNGFSIFYHPEHLSKVPYRKKIILKRMINYNNKNYQVNYNYYARKNNEQVNFKKICALLIKNKILKLKLFNNSKIYYGNCKKITNFLKKKIDKDKFLYIS